MKKFSVAFCLVLTFMLCACCHFGHCAEKNVLAATFPVYLFTANICANVPDVSVQLLVPAQAGCPHDFAPRPADLRKLANAAILVVNGGGLEEFLAKPLEQMGKKPVIIDAGANVPVLEPLQVHAGHVNAHIFASPANAALMSRNIGARLAELDPANAAAYAANTDAYAAKLEELSRQLQSAGEKAKNRTIAIEHDALAYLAANAGLKIVACLENPASASQLADMCKILKAASPAFLAGDAQYSDRLLRTLAQETGLPFVLLNPCANGPENPPINYYEKAMKENIKILEKSLD